MNAYYCGLPERVKPYAQKTLHLLSQLSGLADYQALKDWKSRSAADRVTAFPGTVPKRFG